MKPKEKAEELIDFFEKSIKSKAVFSNPVKFAAKQCAIICVDEILRETADDMPIYYDNGEMSRSLEIIYDEFWLEVRKELEKL